MWLPPQWAKPAMVSVTVPAGNSLPTPAGASNPSSALYTLTTTATAATTYIFDAVLGLEHDQTLTKTHHPVQTGASISSHAYIEPAQLVLNVLMSDVAATYTGSAAWTGNPSKSVSAYQQMLTLQAARIPLTVVTRLRTYYNMLILKVSPREDDKTITGARFRLEFEQMFIANTLASPASARPNDTSATGLGAVNVQSPSASVNSQFNVADAPGDLGTGPANLLTFLQANPSGVDVPGAGSYSSENINSLQQTPSPR